MYHSFRPGKAWLDTDGKPIQAHGGSMIYADGTYYWYGENKEKTDGTTNIWTWGIRCYSSTDLYNWKDCGLIIEPDLKNRESSLFPESKQDRPHIIYNKKTGMYVCWLKVMDDVKQMQTETILTADNILGPYQVVKEGVRPLGMNAGDFDLAVDDETGKGYYFFEKVHTDLIVAELSEDYTDLTEKYSMHFPKPFPPYTREAPAHFIRNGKHYLFTSGTTAYFPNPSEVAVADDWHGPYTVLGNPHPGDPTDTSYHSQISCVFRVEGTDRYIAMADRWKPNHMDCDYHVYRKFFEKAFNPEFNEELDFSLLPKMPEGQVSENTSISTYVWLPLTFHEDGMVTLDWQDEWTLE